MIIFQLTKNSLHLIKNKSSNPAHRQTLLCSRIDKFLNLQKKKKFFVNTTLRHSFRYAWQTAEVEVVADAFFAAEEQGFV